MTNGTINLEVLAHQKANFAHSGREPTSMDRLIRGPRPYYYIWTNGHGMDILIFRDPNNPQTAKLFRYNEIQIHSGVDLERDTPTFVGDQVVKILQGYAHR